MPELPQKPRQHVLEIASQKFCEQILPDEWNYERKQHDYGIDYEIEIVSDTNVTGAHFLIQLKATDHLKGDKTIKHSCQTSTLKYFLQRPELVVYLVYDASLKVGYWLWVQDYIRNQLEPGWEKQKTATLHIPRDNIFNEKAVKKIEQRVLTFHTHSNLLTAVHTVQDPNFDYLFENKGNTTTIRLQPKNPQHFEANPAKFSGVFKFDVENDPEAKTVYNQVVQAIKTGSAATIDARYIDQFNFPNFFSPILGNNFQTTSIHLSSLQNNMVMPFKITILSKEKKELYEVPYVAFVIEQAGLEEVTLSNQHQPNAFAVFRIVLSKINKGPSFNVRANLTKLNVLQGRKLIRLQKALAQATYVTLQNLDDAIPVMELTISEGSFPAPTEKYNQTIEKLAFISEKLGLTIPMPLTITSENLTNIDLLEQVLTSGELRFSYNGNGEPLPLPLNKKDALKFVSNLSEDKTSSLIMRAETFPVEILDAKADLGVHDRWLPYITLLDDPVELLAKVNEQEETSIIEVLVEVGEPGLIYRFHKYLPK